MKTGKSRGEVQKNHRT